MKCFQHSKLTYEIFAPFESGNYIHIPGETCPEKNGKYENIHENIQHQAIDSVSKVPYCAHTSSVGG